MDKIAAPAERIVLAASDHLVPLARAQAVAADLRAVWPGLDVEVKPVRSGRGRSAVDAVRKAVLAHVADVGVADARDMPAGSTPGLVTGAVPQRSDPRDAMVSRWDKVLAYLPAGTRVGTSTAGRSAQLLRRRGDLSIVHMAGDARDCLDRLDGDECDAVVLSVASLDALGWIDRVTEFFDTDQLIPAPGQGALALEHRKDDRVAAAIVAPLDDPSSAFAVTAERACLARLAPEPDAPIGVFAITDGDHMFIHGIVTTPDGTRTARLRWSGPWREAEDVGTTLAELLLSAGGREILAGEAIPPTVNFAEVHRRRLAEEWDAPYPPEEA